MLHRRYGRWETPRPLHVVICCGGVAGRMIAWFVEKRIWRVGQNSYSTTLATYTINKRLACEQ